MTYPPQVVEEYPDRGYEMRPVLREAINEFKAHTPEALWGLADCVNDVFEAMADRDTVGIVNYYRGLMERPVNQRGPDTERNLGKYLTLTGEYEAALPLLEEALDPSSAWRFIDGTYWMGRAQEGLGNYDEAIKRYEEVLEYWQDADFEIEAIKGAREGLARLTS